MKKIRIVFTLFLASFILGVSINSVSASTGVSIYINGEKQWFSNQALIQNGTTLVPLRGIFEELGATVYWNPETKTIDAKKGNTNVWLKIGSKNATVNGSTVKLSVPAQTKNGNTLVPLRFISESLGANVQWDQKSLKVSITGNSANEGIQNPALPVTEEIEVPVLSIGKTFSDDQVDVTIKAVEYVEDGFKVYLSVTNKSDKPLTHPGGLRFSLNESKYEEELHRSGYSNYFDIKGSIYKGETSNGYYEWNFDKNIQIKEIEYNNGIVNQPKAKWIVK